MTRSSIAAILILCAVLTAAADDASLHWNNGDSLSGTLLKADATSLTWQSPMFTDPLQIELSHLASINFPAAEATASDEAEPRIQMRNGDVLNGRLKSITETTMSFESLRFGTFAVARNQILSLQRAGNSGVIYSGLRGLKEWQAAFRRSTNNAMGMGGGLGGGGMQGGAFFNGAKAEPPSENADSTIWSELPDGSLTTKKSDAAIFLPLALPEKFEIEFEVSSTKPVSFLMAIGRNPKYSLRIETWVDVLVAAKHSFQHLKTIGEKDLSIHLYAFVDQTAQTMQVYSETGEKLGEINTTGPETAADGLMLRNGDFDLTLQRLHVSHWDGKTPRIVSGENSRIELSDGTLHFGKVQGFDADSGILKLTVGVETIAVPYADVTSLIVSGQSATGNAGRGRAWLSWKDGGFVSGSLLSVNDGSAVLKAEYSAEPLKCSMTGLIQLGLTRGSAVDGKVGNATSTEVKADRLFHEKGTLQGRLVVEGAADAPIQWTPLGGLNSSTLQGVENARFVRASDVLHLSEDTKLQIAFPDVLYLKNGDVLPCRINACTEDGIEFTSPLTEVHSFPHHHIRAIELTAAGRIHQSGFGAVGWKGFGSKPESDRSKLVFQGNAQYSHPEILTGDTVRFHLEWPKQSWASLTISMFGNGQRDDESCTHVCFNLQPNQLQVLDRPMPTNQNQAIMRFRVGGPQGGKAGEGIVMVKNSQADIQLVAHDGSIVVSVDGVPAKSIKMNSASSARRGIAFNANVTMVGQVIVNGGVQQRAGDGVTLSDFEVDNLSGASIRQFIDEESRQAALTIPRFRRDNPPTHVLIAPNGDLLRGRMLGIEGDLIVFESRLETLRFDRSRVGAIVWLDAPKKGDAEPAAADKVAIAPTEKAAGDADGFASDSDDDTTLQAQLADGFSITMKPLRLVDGNIEGSSALLGKCSFPARSVRELCTGDPAASQRLMAYDTWVTTMAREPDWDIPQSDGGNSAASALIGTTATDFELPMLDGTTFRLSDHKDKIVVLDFWATWCGPCVMALPDYIAATSKFDESKVIFIAVNLQESSDEIRAFLSDKQLSPRVALDRSSAVAPTFQVSGIPHTVILGPGNVIEDVHVGYQPGSGETMQATLQQMLDGTWKRATEEAPAE